MNELIEIRGANHAFEIRNGKQVEYASGDREARMRALGCPEPILKRVREKRSAAIARCKDIAALQGTTPAKLQAASDAAKRSVLQRQGQTIIADIDRDLRSRAALLGRIIAADEVQEQKDSALLERMQNAAGITCGKRR